MLDVLHLSDSALIRCASPWYGRGGFLENSACIAKCGKEVEGERPNDTKPLICRNSYRQLNNDNHIQ